MAGVIAQKYLAEFVGTMFFLLVILSTGGEALAVGAALAIAIMVVGKVSGGHLNPAVTVMMAVAKKMNSNDVLPYIVAQVAGGLVALELHKRLRK
jgi:glycerol uptake facilitator-like aquaporin